MSAELVGRFAPIMARERGKSRVFGKHPNGEKFVYANGRIVIIRDLEDPSKCQVYTEHNHKVTVAKYSPTGNYICSGDITGKIRIWETESSELRLKNEFRPVPGELKDICWDSESKRIAVCGQGGQTHAGCILWDSGNNVGKFFHSKRVNSIDIKQNRPFRLITGDDEFSVKFYEGPPFKQTKEISDHSNFVNAVRFSPDGKYFATASSDTKMFLYDGKTAEYIGEFLDGKTAHTGSVYGIAWSGDSKEILSVSGDKTAKIWDVETRQAVVKFTMGKDVLDQQYGCEWIRDYLVTLSHSGEINFLDRDHPEKPSKVIHGHSEPITQMVVVPSDKNCHVSADSSGKMLWWDTDAGVAHPFIGKGHTNKVIGLLYDPQSNKIISAAWDDKVKFTCASTFDLSAATTIDLGAQPQKIDLAGNYVVVLTNKGIILIKDMKKVYEMENDDRHDPVAIAAYGNCVAVDQRNKSIKIYHIENDALVESDVEIPSTSEPILLSYSPDGAMLAAAYNNKAIRIFQVCDGYKELRVLYGHHQKPTKICWTPSNQHLYSFAGDNKLVMWYVGSGDKEVLERPHRTDLIYALCCPTDEFLLTAGSDCLIQAWRVEW